MKSVSVLAPLVLPLMTNKNIDSPPWVFLSLKLSQAVAAVRASNQILTGNHDVSSGGFLKWGYPISSSILDWMFPNKNPAFSWCPHFRKPPYRAFDFKPSHGDLVIWKAKFYDTVHLCLKTHLCTFRIYLYIQCLYLGNVR